MSGPATHALTIHDCTIVIRAAGERTEAACVNTVRKQVLALGGDPHRQTIVIRERPFVQAVRRTYEAGIDSGAAWVIAMDADVLLLEDGLKRVIDACATAAPGTFTVTPLVLCRFFHGYCFRGLHLYPGSLLPTALGLIESSGAADNVRPESTVVRAMDALGHRFEATTTPVGIHDHEQFFRHIYLKMRLRGRREFVDDHGKTLHASIELMRSLAARGDDDARVAVWGLQDGAADASTSAAAPAHYDWFADYPAFDARLLESGLREKPPLNVDPPASLALERMLGFDYINDQRTPKWIRDRGNFAGGLALVRERFALHAPSAAETPLVPRGEHAQHHQPLRA